MNENSRIEDPSMKQDRIIAPTHEAPPTDRLMSLAYRGLAPLVRELRTVDEALEQSAEGRRCGCRARDPRSAPPDPRLRAVASR
jgi:hypothetical protein